MVGSISDTIIEAINKVGSLFYGPVLSVFILAILFRRAGALGAKLAVLGGVTVNMVLWIGFPGVSWLWWNAAGCLSGIGIGYVVSLVSPRDVREGGLTDKTAAADGPGWSKGYIILGLYFIAIVLISYIVERIWLD